MGDRFTIALENLKSGNLENTSHIVKDLEGAPFIMDGHEYRIIRCYIHESDFSNDIDLSPDLKCRYMDLDGNYYCENIIKILSHAEYLDSIKRTYQVWRNITP